MSLLSSIVGLKKPALQQQSGTTQESQTSSTTDNPTTSTDWRYATLPTDEQLAGDEARHQFMLNQILGLLNQARALKVAMVFALDAHQLPPNIKQMLRKEFIDMAILCDDPPAQQQETK